MSNVTGDGRWVSNLQSREREGRVEKLIPFTVPVIVTAAFQVAFRFAPARRVWPVAFVLILAGTAVAIWFDQHGFNSRSPYPFGLIVIVPALVSGAVANVGTFARWPWFVTTFVGSFLSMVTIVPMYFAACILAPLMRVPGCKF